jgi:hypothetical protein
LELCGGGALDGFDSQVGKIEHIESVFEMIKMYIAYYLVLALSIFKQKKHWKKSVAIISQPKTVGLIFVAMETNTAVTKIRSNSKPSFRDNFPRAISTTILKVHCMPSDTATSGRQQFGAGYFTPDEHAFLQEILAKQLGPEWVSQRPGPAGGMYLRNL